jgi:hypothetical protein
MYPWGVGFPAYPPETGLGVEPVVAVRNVVTGEPVENGALLRSHDLAVDDDERAGVKMPEASGA